MELKRNEYTLCRGCLVAKMPRTSEPCFKPDGNLSPTGKRPTASFTVAKTLILHDETDLVSP